MVGAHAGDGRERKRSEVQDVVGSYIHHRATHFVAVLGRADDDTCVAQQSLAAVTQPVPVMRLERVRVRPQRIDGNDVETFGREYRRGVGADEPGAAGDENGAHQRASVPWWSE